MEFYEGGGFATAKLSWSGPSTPKQIIPQSGRLASAKRLVSAIFTGELPAL
jgi:hypothetical protein